MTEANNTGVLQDEARNFMRNVSVAGKKVHHVFFFSEHKIKMFYLLYTWIADWFRKKEQTPHRLENSINLKRKKTYSSPVPVKRRRIWLPNETIRQ